MKQLEKLYIEFSFPSADTLYKLAKQDGMKIKKKEVDEFVKKQDIRQVFKKVVRRKQKNKPITTINAGREYQMDLIDMSNFSRVNKGNKWILIAVDIFTRQAYAEPTKTKSPEDVLPALEKIFTSKDPFVIRSDSGNEWKGSVEKYLDKREIVHITTNPGNHNVLGVVDRLIQTVKNKLYKNMYAKQNNEWTDDLDRIIDKYNNTPHAGLKGMTPNEADTYRTDVRQIMEEKVILSDQGKLSVGDSVRVANPKSKFSRAYDLQYSPEVYKIVSVSGHNYELDDGRTVEGSKLQKVDAVSDNKIDVAKKAKQEHKIEVVEKRESIDKGNIVESKRERKPNRRYL